MQENNQMTEEIIDKLVSSMSRKQKRKLLRSKGYSYSNYVYKLFKDVKV